MKFALILLCALFSANLATAFTDGEYNCGDKSDDFRFTYKITSLTLNNVTLPHLDITKTYSSDNVANKSYNIKGIATQFTNEQGEEILVLGNITLELNSGRPSCAK